MSEKITFPQEWVDLICSLREDLAREYSHWHFYMIASMRVIGLHREEYREFFEKEAAGEMQHIREFGDLIIGLGAGISGEVADYELSPESFKTKDLLEFALYLETMVTHEFVKRMDQAEAVAAAYPEFKTDCRYVQIFLEEQLMDSRATVDHLKQILNGV